MPGVERLPVNRARIKPGPQIAPGRVSPSLALAVALALLALAAGCGGPPEGGAAAITGEELQARLGTPGAPLVLDVRTVGEYASGHIPGAVHIPHTQIARRLGELGDNRDAEIVVYCTRGPRAYGAEAVLIEAGFTTVRHLQGDITRWRREGRPIER
jgi:rhodanese-related sulfurtransferase